LAVIFRSQANYISTGLDLARDRFKI